MQAGARRATGVRGCKLPGVSPGNLLALGRDDTLSPRMLICFPRYSDSETNP